MIKSVSAWVTIFVFAVSQLTPFCDISLARPCADANISTLAPLMQESLTVSGIKSIPAFAHSNNFKSNPIKAAGVIRDAFYNEFNEMQINAESVSRLIADMAFVIENDAVSNEVKREFREALKLMDKADAAEGLELDARLDSMFTERMLIPMAVAFSRLSKEKREALSAAAMKLVDTARTYPEQLSVSLLINPEKWLMPAEIANRDLDADVKILDDSDVRDAMATMTQNVREFLLSRAGVKGFAHTYVETEDIQDVTPNDLVSLNSDEAKLFATMEHMMKVLEKYGVGGATLLGGAGTRWAKEQAKDPVRFKQMIEQLHELTGLGQETLSAFKSALPVGDNVILRIAVFGMLQAGARQMINMTAFHTDKQANNLLRKVLASIPGAEDILETARFVQPVTPRRDPKTGRIVLVFDGREGQERVLSPEFGPENHFDYIKYMFLSGSFLDLFSGEARKHAERQDEVEDAFGKGSLHKLAVMDSILRVANQDNAAATISIRTDSDGKEHCPGGVALGKLAQSMDEVRVDGLNFEEWVLSLEGLSSEEWDAYCMSDDFRDKMRTYKTMVVEFARTPGRAAGGGLVIHDGNIKIWEKANIRGGGANVEYTNTNTLTMSALALCLSVGLRPSEIKAMMDARNAGQELPSELVSRMSRGVTAMEQIVPNRRKVREVDTEDRNGNPLHYDVEGLERDVHGPFGRLLGGIALEVESMDTFFEADKKEGWDMAYLKGEISHDELMTKGENFAVDVGFIPIKSMDDYGKALRPLCAMMRTIHGVKRENFLPLQPIDDVIANALDKAEEVFGVPAGYVSYEALAKHIINSGYAIPTIEEIQALKGVEEKIAAAAQKDLSVEENQAALDSLKKARSATLARLGYSSLDGNDNAWQNIESDVYMTISRRVEALKPGLGLCPELMLVNDADKGKFAKAAFKVGVSPAYIADKLYNANAAKEFKDISVDSADGGDVSVKLDGFTLGGQVKVIFKENAITGSLDIARVLGDNQTRYLEDLTVTLDNKGARMFYNFAGKGLFEVDSPQQARIFKVLHEKYGIVPDSLLKSAAFNASLADSLTISLDGIDVDKAESLNFFSADAFWQCLPHMSAKGRAEALKLMAAEGGAFVLADADIEVVRAGLQTLFAANVDNMQFSNMRNMLANIRAAVQTQIADKVQRRRVLAIIRGLFTRMDNAEGEILTFRKALVGSLGISADMGIPAVMESIKNEWAKRTDDPMFYLSVAFGLKEMARTLKNRKMTAMADIVSRTQAYIDSDYALGQAA